MTYRHFSELEDGGRVLVRCPVGGCHARIIPYAGLAHVRVENAPAMVSVRPGDAHTHFLQVDDVWDFDNIGVSRPAADLAQPRITAVAGDLDVAVERLLVCSECDRGPLGFAAIPRGRAGHESLQYFLCAASVLYEQT